MEAPGLLVRKNGTIPIRSPWIHAKSDLEAAMLLRDAIGRRVHLPAQNQKRTLEINFLLFLSSIYT